MSLFVSQTQETESEDNGFLSQLVEAFFEPFRQLGRMLVNELAELLTTTPAVYPNPAVEEVFWLCMGVAVLFSGVIVVMAGFFMITGGPLGIPFNRPIESLQRLSIALPLSLAALPLLQLGVDLSNILVEVFKPPDLEMQLTEMAGMGTSLVLIWFINSWALLALVLIFILRNVFLLFVASLAPLLAVAWAAYPSRRYAQMFISGWFVALAIAPLDILALRFNLALLEAGGSGLQPVSNWILGTAGFVLLIWLPYQLYGVSQAMVGQAYSVTRGVQRGTSKRRGDELDNGSGEDDQPDYDDWQDRRDRRGGRRGRRGGRGGRGGGEQE